MSALDTYLGNIQSQVGFEVGDNGISDRLGGYLADFKASKGDPGRAAAFGFEAMKIAWQALPEDIRDAAFDRLGEAIELSVEQVGDVLEDVWVINIVVNVALGVFSVVKEVNANNEAFSLQQKNREQRRTFIKASHPTQWIYSSQRVNLYMDYGAGVGDDRWRSQPSIRPTGQAAKLFGMDALPSSGNCSPGKPYKSRQGNWEAKDDTDPCKAYVQFSALFYPYWSPDHDTDPITFYGPEVWPARAGFRDPGHDPNTYLIERQALLLSDPLFNLQARGSILKKRYDRFLKWFDFNKTVTIDATKVEARDYQADPSPKYYLDDNGLMHAYREAEQRGLAGPRHVVAEWPGLATVTPEKYNCVVGMTRAFFTSRATFLQNRIAMQAYVDDGRVGTLDPDVQKAVRASAKNTPKRAGKKVKLHAAKVIPKGAPGGDGAGSGADGSGGGAGGLVVAGGAAAALILFLRR